ncbi:MAG: (2Fe-2S)-binding protein [Bdellovibrionales bacterium]|nr:(2Fe-2S)-binding protein [Bdellovibrionales bacterium]
MYLCLCKGITWETVQETVKSGANSISQVMNKCEAGSDCGTCRFRIAKVLEQSIGHTKIESEELKSE